MAEKKFPVRSLEEGRRAQKRPQAALERNVLWGNGEVLHGNEKKNIKKMMKKFSVRHSCTPWGHMELSARLCAVPRPLRDAPFSCAPLALGFSCGAGLPWLPVSRS